MVGRGDAAQAVGGPTASCSDERDTAEAEAGARLLCLLAPQHRAAPPQTHAPLLTPPIEVEELGAPPSHGFRLALAGAAPTGAAEKEEAPRKKCLSALLRLSACALEESAKWGGAVGAAGKLYKPGELDAASPAPPPDHAAYSLAGCSPYAPSQLAHAGLRAVGLPPIEQKYLPSGVPTAQAPSDVREVPGVGSRTHSGGEPWWEMLSRSAARETLCATVPLPLRRAAHTHTHTHPRL